MFPVAEKNFLESETGLKVLQSGVGEVGARNDCRVVGAAEEIREKTVLFTDLCFYHDHKKHI